MKHSAPLWMALYVRDFIADTEGLDAEATGAYAMLLMNMWMHGGALPDDDAKLCRMARVSRFKWRRLRPVLMGFMTKIEGNRITQKRLLRELWLSKGFGRKPARSVTLGRGQQEFDFAGDAVATRVGARVQSHSHTQRDLRDRSIGHAREAAAKGLLPPISDELAVLLKKMGLDR
jgi:uncharacterized protein YdaU (DUF1376 family)